MNGLGAPFVHSLMMCDRRRSLYDIANQIDVSFGAVQCILIAILGMSRSQLDGSQEC